MRRSEAIDLLARAALARLTVEERTDLLRRHGDEPPANPADPEHDPRLLLELRQRWRGVRNAALEEALARAGHGAEVEGDLERLHCCPCCHYRTLELENFYEICPVCFWEDDGVRESLAYSAPNRMTLAEGRDNFRTIGACSPACLSAIDPEGPRKYVACSHGD